jgi:hypothetical protein
MKSILLCAIILSSKIAVSQTDEELIKDANRLLNCQKGWKYLSLKSKVEGKILFYMQPLTACGGISTASNAIILTNKGDTIRVLQLCDDISEYGSSDTLTDKMLRLHLNDYVVVTPEGTINWRAEEIPYDPLSCVVKKTYFGDISKKE